MTKVETDAPMVRAYARVVGWDARPCLMRLDQKNAEFPWLALWKKGNALKVTTGGNSPDEALWKCWKQASNLLGVPGGA